MKLCNICGEGTNNKNSVCTLCENGYTREDQMKICKCGEETFNESGICGLCKDNLIKTANANEFQTNRTQEMKDLLHETSVNMELETEFMRLGAELKKAQYDAYIDAGFTAKQAMDLIRAELNNY